MIVVMVCSVDETKEVGCEDANNFSNLPGWHLARWRPCRCFSWKQNVEVLTQGPAVDTGPLGEFSQVHAAGGEQLPCVRIILIAQEDVGEGRRAADQCACGCDGRREIGRWVVEVEFGCLIHGPIFSPASPGTQPSVL
jgi:hypothetical protein